MSASFSVLTVCTGNICRSPAVEYLLRAAFDSSVSVASAGIGALRNSGVDPQMAALLPMDTTAFVSRRLTPELVRAADLILGVTREHRSRAIELHPPAVRRAFTLRELARIMQLPELPARRSGSSDAEALRDSVSWAAQMRARARTLHPEDDDVVDPYRLTDDVFRSVRDQIDEAVTAIAAAIRP